MNILTLCLRPLPKNFLPAGKIPEGHPALPAIPGFNIHALDLDHNHRGDSPVAQRAHTDHNNPTDCPEARVQNQWHGSLDGPDPICPLGKFQILKTAICGPLRKKNFGGSEGNLTKKELMPIIE